MEASTKSAFDFFQRAGFAAELIPRAQTPRADIRVKDGADEYIIEAKSRDISPAFRDLQATASAEGSAAISRNIAPWNATSSMLLEAGEQLRSTLAETGALRLIWILAEHSDEDFVVECITRRLNGYAELLVVKGDLRSFDTKPCFYYERNDFHRLIDVHAAVLCCSRGMQMLVNSFCSSRQRLRESRLYKLFAERNAICDPEMLEARGDAFMLGADFNPGPEPNAQWVYLKNKYGALTSRIHESQFNSLLVIRRDEFDTAQQAVAADGAPRRS